MDVLQLSSISLHISDALGRIPEFELLQSVLFVEYPAPRLEQELIAVPAPYPSPSESR